MSTNLDRLLWMAGEKLGPAINTLPDHLCEQAGVLAGELERVLVRKNGFYAFENAVHLFPYYPNSDKYDLTQWNDEGLWRSRYGDAAKGMLFFAEDIFGEQFVIKDGRVCRFRLETGESEEIAPNLEEWAKRILDDYDFEIGFSIGHEWQLRNKALSRGERLSPDHPFALGGSHEIGNLHAIDSLTLMLFNAQLANQIRDLPIGTEVKIKIVD